MSWYKPRVFHYVLKKYPDMWIDFLDPKSFTARDMRDIRKRILEAAAKEGDNEDAILKEYLNFIKAWNLTNPREETAEILPLNVKSLWLLPEEILEEITNKCVELMRGG